MNSVTSSQWIEANQSYLMGRVAAVRQALERRLGGGTELPPGSPSARTTPPEDLALARDAEPPAGPDETEATRQAPPFALDVVSAAFGLSPFERDLLLLCAGPDLDSKFCGLIASLQGDTRRTSPTFSLALGALPGAHWSALAPVGPLRRWRLLELGTGDALTSAPLRIDEHVLHFLTGLNHPDDRLQGLVRPVAPSDGLPPSQTELVGRVAYAVTRSLADPAQPVVQLNGPDFAGRRAVAAAACAALGLRLCALRAADIPAAPADRETLARFWEREAVLRQTALLLELDDTEDVELGRGTAPFLEGLHGIVLVSKRDPWRARQRPVVRFEVTKPTVQEQKVLWQQALGPAAAQLDGQLDRIVAQFSLGCADIRAASAGLVGSNGGVAAVPTTHGPDPAPPLRGTLSPSDGERAGVRSSFTSSASPDEPNGLADRLWDLCRDHTRPRLDDLAQRLKPLADWDDLILPEEQRRTLREIAAQVRHRFRVYDAWGFSAKCTRGLGISALFTGPSGTGKTMAAEVLAHELQLDLYRIDLSQVVNKYIGETEKNLRRVFDAAEDSGVILLFDEAEALFGKRSEVKDSHDRYANIEVSYLLQRMEAYRGLAILTTNLKTALDTAFLRRIRFVVQFPFPDAAQRAEIWRRIFPTTTPTEGLDVRKLSCLNVPGGNIRNIALNAAFLAADDGQSVRMSHLLRAARTEYAKLEKPLADAETRGW